MSSILALLSESLTCCVLRASRSWRISRLLFAAGTLSILRTGVCASSSEVSHAQEEFTLRLDDDPYPLGGGCSVVCPRWRRIRPRIRKFPARKVPPTAIRWQRLALSNDSLQLRYYDKKDSDDDSRFVGGAFLGEERDIVLTAAMMFPVDLGQHFDVTFGPQLYAALLNEENEGCDGGERGRRTPLVLRLQSPLRDLGQAFYSPDILTFGAADNLMDLSARAEMQISDRLIGVRRNALVRIRSQSKAPATRTLQEEVFFGVRYRM